MVAAFGELDHGGAAVASLPAFFFGDFDEALSLGIARALAGGVGAVVADAAHLGTAAFAFSDLAPRLHSDVFGLDPLAAMARGAVDPIFRGVLLELAVPDLFEVLIEDAVDVLQWDVVGGAAPGGHVRGVGDGHGEDAFKAGVAHAVGAG